MSITSTYISRYVENIPKNQHVIMEILDELKHYMGISELDRQTFNGKIQYQYYYAQFTESARLETEIRRNLEELGYGE